MVIQIGDRTVNAQRLVGVENRRVKERVPIHHHHMMEKTVVHLGLAVLPGNATIRSVQVNGQIAAVKFRRVTTKETNLFPETRIK